MSRDKSVWFAEEILLDAKLINCQLEAGEWDAVEDMLRAEAQLSRDADTGRARPKKASEYTLRLIAEVLHIMRLDVEQVSYNRATLAVAEQCLRLVRSCAASGTKMQTYISKDLSILDSMLLISTEYQHPSGDYLNEQSLEQYESCMVVLVQTLGNLVVNNPFNQIIIWNKFDTIILNSLVGTNERIASAAAMIVYNILLGQPHVFPDDALLLNSLAYMYNNGNTEYPHLIIEYLIGVENTYIEKLYPKLEPECRMLVLGLAYNILMSTESQDINVSVNFVRFMAHEFKSKSDMILKTVDKYVNSIEPQEVVFLLDILATASSMDAYIDTLQSDVSLFINCAFLLRGIHKLGKESENFFTSLSKLCLDSDSQKPDNEDEKEQPEPPGELPIPLSKNASADTMLSCQESASECTESECSEQYFECIEDAQSYLQRVEPLNAVDSLQQALKFTETLPENLIKRRSTDRVVKSEDLVKVAFVKGPSAKAESVPSSRKISLEHKIDIDEEPPLILDPSSPQDGSINTIAEVFPLSLQQDILVGSADTSPDDPVTEIQKTTTPPEVLREIPPEVSSEVQPEAPPEILPEEQKQSPETPKESIKKSQNLSTDFDLSEQLQKILGISDKARSDGGEGWKAEKRSDTQKGVTVADQVVKLPSVKIDSPDSQRTRLGAVDASNAKRLTTSVRSAEQHVAFGFKAALVRVLANLSWKHPANKRQMRELELIPVLFDCCNMDARNPLIMQWVIFAIRNLCENCPENQAVISAMTLQGPVNNEVLQDIGLVLHTDERGGGVRLAPLARP